jgi:hypothetical protein
VTVDLTGTTRMATTFTRAAIIGPTILKGAKRKLCFASTCARAPLSCA